jgi:DNA-binding XRE family transcriptional regulator
MKTKAWKDIRRKLGRAAEERIARRKSEAIVEMDLQELRTSVAGLTQRELADVMRVTQAAISQLEAREDVLLSKLAEYVKALGGELELVAHFPDRAVRITQFEGVRERLTGSR